jgi:hypothetical protein
MDENLTTGHGALLDHRAKSLDQDRHAMEERRKHQRVEVDEAAYIYGDGSSTRCRVRNVSPEGAAIDVPNPSVLPDRFKLTTEKDRVTRDCRVIWIIQNRVGVAFECPNSPAADRGEEFF